MLPDNKNYSSQRHHQLKISRNLQQKILGTVTLLKLNEKQQINRPGGQLSGVDGILMIEGRLPAIS